MRFALKNATIYTGEQRLIDHVIIISGERIESVIPTAQFFEGCDVIDLSGYCIAPGFIDLQVNGGGGVLLMNEMTPTSMVTISRAHRQFGTTNMLLTLISPSAHTILASVQSAKQAMEQDHSILGLHIEGPFIEHSKRGIHPLQHIRPLTEVELHNILQINEQVIKMMTVAPEMVSDVLIQTMVAQQIVVSLGHSNCTSAQATQAFRAGATKVTHLFNAMSPLQSREPGLVGAALLDKDVWCGIIADGHHVSFETLQLAYSLKKGKLLLITDAMATVGSNDTTFTLGNDVIYCVDGKCTNAQGTLAGAHLTMIDAVKNCVQHLDIPLEEAIRMASTYPARALQLDHELGKIKSGYLANLTIFTDDFAVAAVIVNGTLQSNESHTFASL